MENRLNNIVRGTKTGIINKVVTVLFPLIIRLVTIRTIGIEYLGLNSLFGSVISILGITELGFSSAMVYSLYKPLAEDDVNKVNALLKFIKRVYFIIGGIITVSGLAIIPFLDIFVSNDTGIEINIMLLYLMYLLNTVMGYFLFSYKMSLLIALQRTDVNNKIQTKVMIGEYIAQLLILFFLKDYYLFVLMMPMATMLNNIIVAQYVNKHYSQYCCKGKLKKAEVKALFKKFGALAGNKINGTLILSADNLVISAFLGVTSVAMYQNYYTIIGALVSFIALLFDSLRPSIGNSLVTESLDKNYGDYNSVTMLVSWMSGWCSICLLCLFQPFISMYYGSQFLLDISTVILLAFYFYIWKMLDVQTLYRDAAGLWWTDRFRPYIVSIANLIINIALVRIIGINGVVISTVGTQLFISFPWLIIALNKEYFKKGIITYCRKLAYYFFVIVIAALITYIICSLVTIEYTLVAFLIKAAVCLFVPNGIIYIFYRKSEEFQKIAMIVGYIISKGLR